MSIENELEVLKVYCEKQKVMIADLIAKVLWLETKLDMARTINNEKEENAIKKQIEEENIPILKEAPVPHKKREPLSARKKLKQ